MTSYVSWFTVIHLSDFAKSWILKNRQRQGPKLCNLQEAIRLIVINEIFKFPPHLDPFGQKNEIFKFPPHLDPFGQKNEIFKFPKH